MHIQFGLSHYGEEHELDIQNMVLCITESKREEVTGDWRKFHNGGLHHFHFSKNIITVFKS